MCHRVRLNLSLRTEAKMTVIFILFNSRFISIKNLNFKSSFQNAKNSEIQKFKQNVVAWQLKGIVSLNDGLYQW